jgi:hypothetical protein
MSAILHARFKLALLLATALVAAVPSGEGYAYTMEQQQACTPDVFRLCSSEIPDVDRITACMIRNRSQLSPQCRAFFRSGPESGEVVGVRPAAAQKKTF